MASTFLGLGLLLPGIWRGYLCVSWGWRYKSFIWWV